MDCYILFSEHGLTSFLCVLQLQLEAFLAPFVYLVSVNPSTFRDEPDFSNDIHDLYLLYAVDVFPCLRVQYITPFITQLSQMVF